MLCLPLRQTRLDIGEIGAHRRQEGADRGIEGPPLGAAPSMLESVAIAGRSAAAALRRRSGLGGLGNGIVPFVRRSGRRESPLPCRSPRRSEIDRAAGGKSSLPIGNPRQDLGALGRALGACRSAVAPMLEGVAVGERRAGAALRHLARFRRFGRLVGLIRISRVAHGQHYTPAARPV